MYTISGLDYWPHRFSPEAHCTTGHHGETGLWMVDCKMDWTRDDQYQLKLDLHGYGTRSYKSSLLDGDKNHTTVEITIYCNVYYILQLTQEFCKPMSDLA